jgi:hypothetical protein
MPLSEKASVSADEIIATLKRSSLPTIIVEGGDDLIVLRRMEVLLTRLNVSVLPAEGRNTVLEIYRRRREIDSGRQLAFVADRDGWVCTSVPEEYVSKDLIFTDGYSIENDIYRDGKFLDYLEGDEVRRFEVDIERVIDCYALGIHRILCGRGGKVAYHPNMILDDANQYTILSRPDEGEEYPNDLRARIVSNYGKLLRGKTLLGILMRQLSRPGRHVRHNSRALMDMVAKNPGQLLNMLFRSVESAFSDA